MATIQRWGNSLAVRIPRGITKQLRVEAGTPVEIVARGGAIVLRPKKRRRYSLKELLKNCKRGQLHGEIDYGPDLGREALD